MVLNIEDDASGSALPRVSRQCNVIGSADGLTMYITEPQLQTTLSGPQLRLWTSCRVHYSAGNADAFDTPLKHACVPEPASDAVVNIRLPLPAVAAVSTVDSGVLPAHTPVLAGRRSREWPRYLPRQRRFREGWSRQQYARSAERFASMLP
ncbi:hypothetical protein MRX96_013230 [Rhipicephalus microplus]